MSTPIPCVTKHTENAVKKIVALALFAAATACTDGTAPVDNGAATTCASGTAEQRASAVCRDVTLANGAVVAEPPVNSE